MHGGFLIIAPCGWRGRSAQSQETRTDLFPQCHPYSLIGREADPVSFSHAPLPIVFFLIDVDSGHLSSRRGSWHGARGAKCLHAFIRFYPGVRRPGAGWACGRRTRPYVELFSTCWSGGQTCWVMEDISDEEVGGAPRWVLSFQWCHRTRARWERC